jgi:hypothetical protein
MRRREQDEAVRLAQSAQAVQAIDVFDDLESHDRVERTFSEAEVAPAPDVPDDVGGRHEIQGDHGTSELSQLPREPAVAGPDLEHAGPWPQVLRQQGELPSPGNLAEQRLPLAHDRIARLSRSGM